MTKPNLDEKRDALAVSQTLKSEFEDLPGKLVCNLVKTGWNAALEALRESAPVEFDEKAAQNEAYRIWPANDLCGRVNVNATMRGGFDAGARWQFSRDKELIAAAENAARAINGQLGEALDRVAELTEAIVFSLRGLQMWRKYQSPGNIAEVEQRLRQALKRDGGSK